MNKVFSFLAIFYFGFVCFPISAQQNKIVNKSTFLGFYENENCIGRIEDNKIQFYNFSNGVWQKNTQKEFALPNGYTKAFTVGDWIGVVVPNSSSINTIQFFEPNNAFFRTSNWKRLTKADFVLPAASIDVVGHSVIDFFRGDRRVYEISVIDRERVRRYSYSNNTGWESSYIIEEYEEYEEYWGDKLPRGVSYVVGHSGKYSGLGYMPVVNNKIQFYYLTAQGVTKDNYEFLLPNGWSDVFAADGTTIAVSVNSEIRFYSLTLYDSSGYVNLGSKRNPDKDL